MGAVQTILVYGFLGLLVAMAIVAFVPKHCAVSKVEGFKTNTNPVVCPDNTKSYYDKEGNLNCCRGQVNGNRCEGEPICTFSGDVSKLPFCGRI